MLKNLDSFSLHHAFVDVERMKLAMNQEQWQDVEGYLCLFEIREDNNPYIRLVMAAAYEKLEQWDKAGQIYLALLDETPDMYAAGMGKARCLFHGGKYQEAKELTLDMLEISKNDEQGQQLMHQINERLIEDFMARDQKLTAKDQIDPGWCYLQNEQYDKALALVESMEVDEADPKQKKRKRRLPYAHFCLGICCQKFSESDPAQTEKGLEYMKTAIESEKDVSMRLSYMSKEAEWMNKLQRYEECTDICDRILEEDKRYMPAYVLRQEASYRLQRGQEAVDVTYTYDVNALLEVEVRVVSTGKTERKVIRNQYTKMTDEEINRRFEELSYLKIHPRDQEENKLWLLRGEHLYEESFGNLRIWIEQALEQFERVLETRNHEKIAKAREEFIDFLKNYEDYE